MDPTHVDRLTQIADALERVAKVQVSLAETLNKAIEFLKAVEGRVVRLEEHVTRHP